jgi:hypothetical protein
MKAPFFIFPLVILIGCTNRNNTESKYANEMPGAFSFTISKSLVDSYNSKEGIYTRVYSGKDSSVKVEFTKEEMELIYQSFKKYDFLSFPKKFECDTIGISDRTPAFFTTIVIEYKNETIKVTNGTTCDNKVEQIKSDNFYKFSSEINEILKNKPQVKNMRETDMFFM